MGHLKKDLGKRLFFILFSAMSLRGGPISGDKQWLQLPLCCRTYSSRTSFRLVQCRQSYLCGSSITISPRTLWQRRRLKSCLFHLVSWFLLSMLSGEGRLRRCGRVRLLLYALNRRTQRPKRGAYKIAGFRLRLCLSIVFPCKAVGGRSLGAVFL